MSRRLTPLLALLLFGLLAGQASAHAQLEGTSPERGVVVPREPAQVSFRFDEPVEQTLGAVRVYDAEANRVDTGPVLRPGGKSAAVGVALKSGLPNGTYTATYRVVSADGHTVSGGMTFSVGAAGTRPPASVDKLLDGAKAGAGASVARDVGQGLVYAALALLAGGLAWLVLCAAPALRATEGRSADAGLALLTRARRLGLAAAAVGALASLLALTAEAAEAGGLGLFDAADLGVLREIARTRSGTVLSLEGVAFLLALGLLALARPRALTPVGASSTPRPAREALVVGGGPQVALAGPRGPNLHAAVAHRSPHELTGAGSGGGSGSGLTGGPAWTVPGGRGLLVALGLVAAALVVLPAFEGHQATQPQPWGPLLDVAHVGAMALWIGGITATLLVLPSATRRLDPAARTQLLAGSLRRFSPLALTAVLTLALTGTFAAIFELGKVPELWQAGYGRVISLKLVLLALLVGAGAIHRRRALPELDRLAAAGDQPPGAAGHLVRRVLRGEAVLLAGVLAATALLVASSPPGAGATGGPLTLRQPLGPLQLETTVDPARPGANAVHIYLYEGRSGAPFEGTKELTATVTLPGKIEPLPVTLRRAGPGHYVADTLQLAPAGTWHLRLIDRVSDFDQYETDVKFRVR